MLLQRLLRPVGWRYAACWQRVHLRPKPLAAPLATHHRTGDKGQGGTGMETSPAQDVPAPVTPYGDDPSAATASAAADVRGAEQEAERAAEGALGEAASQASGFVGETARAVRKAVGAAADAARGVVGAAAEAAKPEEADTDDYRNFEGRPTYADSPGTSGHAADRFRLIKEADDSMQGGVPEPAVKID